MFYIAICEDDIIQRKLLTRYLNQIFKYLELDYLVFEFESGEKLLSNYPEKIDILFLDIHMGKLTGMDTAKKIREFDKKVEIIFITAITDYIQDGYEVRAYRYLLKPLKYKNILKHTKACVGELIDNKDTMIIKDKSQMSIVNINDIFYIEVLRKEVTVYLNQNQYTFKSSMKSIEENLIKKNFFRCHKSYLINLKQVKALIEKENIVIIDSYKIPISKYKLKSLKLKLANLLGERLC